MSKLLKKKKKHLHKHFFDKYGSFNLRIFYLSYCGIKTMKVGKGQKYMYMYFVLLSCTQQKNVQFILSFSNFITRGKVHCIKLKILQIHLGHFLSKYLFI